MPARTRSRTLALGAFGAGGAALLAAVVSGMGAGSPVVVAKAAAAEATIRSHTVAYPHARVAVQVRPGGLTCFHVSLGSSTVAQSCAMQVLPDQIEYATSRYAVGGLAGAEVRAVIVRLTRKGTVWATMRRGTFFAAVPKGHNVRAVVKVLRDGSRTSFTVTGPR